MSFFNPEIPIKDKIVTHHPWEKYIKDIYTKTYKYAHNSANNPVYPRKKEKKPNANRVKFTVIGIRVIKDFIYSVNIVKGLHKYRWKFFEAPVIRGVTSVEWPKVWNDLKLQYGGLAYCIKSPLAVLMNDRFLGGFPEFKELIESKYIYHLNFDYYKEGVNQFARFIKSSGRPCAYMHISVDDNHIGTFIFMLYSDVVPLTCENFLRLCQTKRGGYSGTPIHRIVKDCWIQCGGFGLKNTSLDCENFIIPPDRRGVLCMANDGRHVDCSTQFFVLLQPAPWMAHKYVAFGQLIDGEETLKKIEGIQTWYEAPTSDVIIFDAGILNMDCHGITINKETNAYIQGHIEDLNALGDLLYEEVMEKVYLEIKFRELQRLRAEGEEEHVGEEGTKNIRATQRFMRKKEDIEKQLETSQTQHATSAISKKSENNEFDVEVYEYEPEEYLYLHVTSAASASLVVKPVKPFYLPLTDVPYPGEVDSTYDLKKFLRGDYCLESDLDKKAPKKADEGKVVVPSDLFEDIDEQSKESSSEESLDSDEANEIKRYLKTNGDNISFAGGVIKNIARKAHGKHRHIRNGTRKSALITDEELRRLRLATADHQHLRDKKVSISVPIDDKMTHTKIKRRQTGFVRPNDFASIRVYQKEEPEVEEEEDEDGNRKVRIAGSALRKPAAPPTHRRPTAFVRSAGDEDEEVGRPSVLARLYDEVKYDDDTGPTLKDYKPYDETQTRNRLFLTSSPQSRMRSTENDRDKYRQSLTVADNSMENVLNLQHGKRPSRKISSDYVKTIDQIEHKKDNSIRSVEYAKTRPAISVSEYQLKNLKYQEKLKASKTNIKTDKHKGLRLPGDTPLYQSLMSVRDEVGKK